MSRVTPRRIVAVIEAVYPWTAGGTDIALHSDQAANLGMIATLAEQLAEELRPPDPEDYTVFVAAVAAIKATLEQWAGMHLSSSMATPLHASAALGGLSPPRALREVLLRAPEEATRPAEAGLAFIRNVPLRESLRLDLSRARRALQRGDFKSATVLAGAVTEGLLLDAVSPLLPSEIRAARAAWKSASKRIADPKPARDLDPAPEKWSLHELVWIAAFAGVISQAAAAAADVARDFRNLIHPGKQRTTAPADEGTAFAAIGGALRVAAELEARTAKL